ncbi:DUF434 domain-containing protein [Clostridium beijerinckii]|jgi:Uncharacterized conserved protein|uniref:DUF434 domain-containing protein n=2 Tax=Clostridium beijerinckii TaxID=1520 RepID=A0AAE2RWB3_CLOBE|nr:DUF434 domain-containing protein [Clostridium beijerinckii]ABR33685.1 protein of unknown function DUF434 [Clostridium beijerinckii NCIMB 8052]AIU03305.1 hypothetical protein Cbs_1509 [Clostridium beijerinckii ATCC 35702]ALB47207.1 DUF434 domain-containing protein [Clostridium beijerinckii NRRL B-598]MBF7812104.1 DUF434 domain-containing protein [Clostridium beijerinckii]NRT25039.1 hypothetical protein [Clostridium beijerinckii]
MTQIVKRGFVPSDEIEFNEENLTLLKKAQKDIYYLINQGYSIDKSVEFVGNHFLFSARQRLALKRSTSSYKDIISRQKRKILDTYENSTLHIDGLNIIITLEVALSNSTLIKCMDGTLRDLAGLRGTYKLIDKTDTAIDLIGKRLDKMKIRKAIFYLDSPVSNTGRLKSRLLELLYKYNFDIEVILIPNADVILNKLDHVVTSDGIILNTCESWINLAYEIVEEELPSTSYIDFEIRF